MAKTVKAKKQTSSIGETEPKRVVKGKEEEVSKGDVIGWKGGCSLPFSRKMKSGKTLREELSAHLDELLSQELRNQEARIENIAKWQKQYKGDKPPKSFPFDKASNIAIPITRSNTDALHVRVQDTIFGYPKIVTCKAQKPEFVDIAPEVEKGLNHWLKFDVNFKEKVSPALFQCMQTGTGIIKLVAETKTRTTYRYANEEELKNQDIPKYSIEHLGSKEKIVKVVETVSTGPNIYPVDRSDFVISSEATSVDDAYLVGHRTRLRKAELKQKVTQGIYDEKEVEKITDPDKFTETQESRADSQGKELKKIPPAEPFEVWELWTKFDVDEDGEEDDICVEFHRGSKTIPQGIYNPIFGGFRPFVAFVYSPVPFSFDGEGVCEILEKLQVGIDTLENQRIDRMTQINGPLIFVREGCGLNDYKITPGKVEVVDDDLESAIKIVNFASDYYSTVQEEDRLISYADRAVGLTPNVMGQGTASRPVAKETFALIQEANKKFKSGNENIRDDVGETVTKSLEMFAQYQPVYAYKGEKDGMPVVETVEFPIEDLRGGLKIEVYASSEVINQELRRDATLTIYHLLSEWSTKNASMVQALCNPQVPSDFKNWLVAQYAMGVKVIKRILDDFDQRDSDDLVVELPEAFDVDKAIANSMDLIKQQQQQPGMPGEAPGMPGMPPTPAPQFTPPQMAMQIRGTPGEFTGQQ